MCIENVRLFQSIALQNLNNLRFFPMLRSAPALQDILIRHCEQLRELDLSHLPGSITSLHLAHTGVTRLEHVTDTALTFPFLTAFTVEQSTLTSIRGGFFRAFPALVSLTIQQNHLILDRVDWDAFATERPLLAVLISDNDLAGTAAEGLNAAFFKSLMDSLNMNGNSMVTLSNNGFRIHQARAIVFPLRT